VSALLPRQPVLSRPLAALLMSLALVLTGCGGGDYKGDLIADEPPLGGQPGNSAGDPAALCQAELQRFNQDLWQPVLQPGCVNCHQSNGIAAETQLVFANGNSDAQLQSNLLALNDYINSRGQQALLDKPLANGPHGGGQIFRQQSAQHVAMLNWLSAEPAACDGVIQPPVLSAFWDNSVNASVTDTLRKAALLFAGRLPTETELAQVIDGDELSLRRTIRGLMQGDGFSAFIMESTNDRLLTNKFANGRTPGLDLIYQTGRFSYVDSRLEPLQQAIDSATNDSERDAARAAFNQAWSRTNEAVATAPLQLVDYVVRQERPYSEILTADYLMVNPYSNDVYHTGVAFTDDQDEDDWRPARITDGYALGPLPHAGLLSSQMFLARYPSTDTNRNRARARWAYYFFLGVDIEGLAVRSMDPDALADSNNPTLNNPACSGCHSVMDPVAGAFQNWGDNGHYRDAWDGDDSLPDTYKSTALYQPGDLWYRDMRTPGFNGAALPQAQQANSLQWLAQNMVADSRFASGSVRFWWPAVFGSEPLPLPTETQDSDYQQKLAIYSEQQRLITELAQRFADGHAGTATHGVYNLKDLLVDMVLTPVFRAATTNGNPMPDSDMGQGQLLTAEQLNRKIHSATGYTWHHSWDPDNALLTTDFYGIYGGIDSDTVVQRATQLNTMMYAVSNRLSHEMVCDVVIEEFSLSASQRQLFTLVEMDDTPLSNAAAVQQQVNRLIDRIWGNPRTDLSLEQQQAFNLFREVWQSRLDSAPSDYLYHNNVADGHDDNDEYCRLDWDNADNGALLRDPNHTLRAWMALLSYLLSDFVVLHE